jgi:hypothetical protein
MKWQHSDKDLPSSETRILFKDADNKSKSVPISSGFYGCLIPVASPKATQGRRHKHILFHESFTTQYDQEGKPLVDLKVQDSRTLRFWWIPYPSHENI